MKVVLIAISAVNNPLENLMEIVLELVKTLQVEEQYRLVVDTNVKWLVGIGS